MTNQQRKERGKEKKRKKKEEKRRIKKDKQNGTVKSELFNQEQTTKSDSSNSVSQ